MAVRAVSNRSGKVVPRKANGGAGGAGSAFAIQRLRRIFYKGRFDKRRRQKVRRRMPIRIKEALRPIQRPRTPQCWRKQSQAPKGRPMSQ